MPAASWTLLTDVLLHRALHAPGGPDDPTHSDGGYVQLLDDARAKFVLALAGSSPLALVVRRAQLAADEAEVLATLCAVELDPARQQAVAKVSGDPTQRRLDLAQLAALFGPDHLGPRAVAPDSALVRAALVEVGAAPTWALRTAGPASRLTWFLTGDDSPDSHLPFDLEVVAGAGVEPGAERGVVLAVVGSDPARRLQAIGEVLPCNLVLVADVPESTDTWSALVREATISNTGIALRVGDALSLAARAWIERTPHLEWALSSAYELPLDTMPRRPWREVLAADPHVGPLEIDAVLGDPDRDPANLRDRRLTAHQLHLIASATDAVGGTAAAVRRLVAGPIEKMARRIRPQLGWDDLILPADQIAQLREVADRYLHRNIVYGEWGAAELPSPGVVALFTGPSGTGKTTAAEVIAGELGVDLFKIDVSAVVSKYIGETEQNLEQLFTAAESGDAMLCFDEADALLGKRSEVSDARDRYANIEVSYLLQRLETYRGLVVMTSNLQSNLDDAFVRRMHARVSFTTPGPGERARIWERALAGVPTKDVDLAAIAERFDLVGGAIRNAAMNGAFLAATAHSPLTMELLLRGIRREFQKQGRLITPELFGPWYELIR